MQGQMYLDHDAFLDAARMFDDGGALVEYPVAGNMDLGASSSSGVNEEPHDKMGVERGAASDNFGRSLGDPADISEVPPPIMSLADSRVSLVFLARLKARRLTIDQVELCVGVTMHAVEAEGNLQLGAAANSEVPTQTGTTQNIPVDDSTQLADSSGRSKRKRIPRQTADALNGCLCGVVLSESEDGVLKCHNTGCETQWVSTSSCLLDIL